MLQAYGRKHFVRARDKTEKAKDKNSAQALAEWHWLARAGEARYSALARPLGCYWPWAQSVAHGPIRLIRGQSPYVRTRVRPLAKRMTLGPLDGAKRRHHWYW